MKTFLETLIALYSQMPAAFWYHFASLVGSGCGLIFFPPEGLRAGIMQVIASYCISHYGSLGVLKGFPQTPVELVRFVLGATGYAIGQGVAKLGKQFSQNPTGTFWEAILQLLVKFRELFPRKES